MGRRAPGDTAVVKWRTGNPACPRRDSNRDRQDCLSSTHACALKQFAEGSLFGLTAVAVLVGAKPMKNIADALRVGLLGLFMCVTVVRTGAVHWV